MSDNGGWPCKLSLGVHLQKTVCCLCLTHNLLKVVCSITILNGGLDDLPKAESLWRIFYGMKKKSHVSVSKKAVTVCSESLPITKRVSREQKSIFMFLGNCIFKHPSIKRALLLSSAIKDY